MRNGFHENQKAAHIARARELALELTLLHTNYEYWMKWSNRKQVCPRPCPYMWLSFFCSASTNKYMQYLCTVYLLWCDWSSKCVCVCDWRNCSINLKCCWCFGICYTQNAFQMMWSNLFHSISIISLNFNSLFLDHVQFSRVVNKIDTHNKPIFTCELLLNFQCNLFDEHICSIEIVRCVSLDQ